MKLKKLFSKPTAYEIAVRELEEAEVALLTALTARDYAASYVIYNTSRIERLKRTIKAAEVV